MNGLLEILTNRKWMMHPESLQALRMVIQQNLAGHVPLGQFDKKEPYGIAMNADGNHFHLPLSAEDKERRHVQGGSAAAISQDEYRFVAVLPVCGPITRNGDACSYGSIDLRNAILTLADDDDCKGIVFYINSPGGSAAAIPDYKYAINFLHERGKRCIAFVDGFCGSAAMYLAALCDERFYMNDEDQIGSIGVMAAFYTEKDGEKNQYTNNTYHELYATDSYEKNKWHRDAANGEYTELIADLDRACAQFQADIKAACPNVKDEHLHGAVFDAKDVTGILTDGKSTLPEVIDRLLATSSASAPTASASGSSSSVQGGSASSLSAAPVPTASASGSSSPVQGGSAAASPINSNSLINMSNYPLINAALGLNPGDMVITEEGTHMNASLLDTLEAKLSAQNQLVADAQQKATSAESTLAELQSQFDALSEKLKTAEEAKALAEQALTDAQASHAQALADAQTSHDSAIEALNAQIASANEAHALSLSDLQSKLDESASALSTAQSELAGAKDALATAEQSLADKDAQIASLMEDSGNEPSTGASPANNGEGANTPSLRVFDPSQYKTNAERKAAFEAFKRGE